MATNIFDTLDSSEGVDPALVNAVINQESSGNAAAIGPSVNGKTAKGLMQLEDSTGQEEFKRMGLQGQYDPLNAEQNKKIGTHYLGEQLKSFGDERLALAAYNAGPKRVKDLQATYGSDFEDIEHALPDETKKYVPGVIARRNQAAAQAQESDGDRQSQNILKAAPNTAQGFAQALLPTVSDPSFNDQPLAVQGRKVAQLYAAKRWSPDTDQVAKKVFDNILDAADPREKASALSEMKDAVGPPPILKPGDSGEDTLKKWRASAVQKLIYSGVNPVSFGTHLDTYFDNATKAETEAAAYRNESSLGKGLDTAGNVVRNLAKGFMAMPADVIAGAIQQGYTPSAILAKSYNMIGFGGLNVIKDPTPLSQDQRNKLAQDFRDAPEALGSPSNAHLYATDLNGNLQLNSDGTPQLKAQSTMASVLDGAGKFVGQTAAFLAGGVEAKALGGAKAAATAIFGANYLSLSGDSFDRVYKETGDVDKSYRAAALTLPAAAIGSAGELGIISRTLSPVFRNMSFVDKARYVAQSWVKNALTGGASMAATDAAQQAAETSQTGKSYDPTRTEVAAGAGAVASGTIGGFIDYGAGVTDFRNNQKVPEALNQFRNSVETQKVIPGTTAAPDLTKLYGVTVTPQKDGTLLLTKNTDIAPAETLPGLVKQLKNSYSASEVTDLGKRQAELLSKDSRTEAEEAELSTISSALPLLTRAEHHNNVKMLEGQVAEVLKDDPGALPVRHDPTTQKWTNVETGEKSSDLKDVLFRKPEEPEFTHDVSDTSHIKFLDEDSIKARSTEAPPPIDPQAHEQQVNSQRDLDKANIRLLELKNDLDEAPEESKAGIKEEIKSVTLDKRVAQQDLLRLKPTLDTETAANEAYKARQKENLKSQALIDIVKKKGLGAIVTEGEKSQIVIPSGLTPEAKVQVTAHELGHAITDKVPLSDEAKAAVRDKLQELQDKSPATKASDMASEVLLPEVSKAVKVPEGVTAAKLKPSSRAALMSEREFLANQIGAVMLKRAGKDIGDYKILPEIEQSLSRVKLPDVGGAGERSNTKAKTATPGTQNQAAQVLAPQVEASQGGGASPSSGDTINFNANTGKQHETEYSKTIGEEIPQRPPTMADSISRIKNDAEARAWVDRNGMSEAFKALNDSSAHTITPEARIGLINEVQRRANADFEANPTPEKALNVYTADQLRALSGTAAGQQLALLSRFRNVDSFSNLISTIAKVYREGGETPKFTEYMLKELQAMYDKAAPLPEGPLRNSAFQKIFERSLAAKNLSWRDFLGRYVRKNLLCSPGTLGVVTESSVLMGPVFTALAHPRLGRGLILRAMLNEHEFAVGAAKRALEGKVGTDLFEGEMDPEPVKLPDYKDILKQAQEADGVLSKTNLYAKSLAAIEQKFGSNFLNALSAAHAYARHLTISGKLAEYQYRDLVKKYGDDPAKLSAEHAKLLINPDQKAAAITQARKEAANVDGISEGDIYARAFQILKEPLDASMISEANEFSLLSSHRGKAANLLQHLASGLLNAPIWEDSPLGGVMRTFVQPFGNAVIKLSDYAQDIIPGNQYVDKGLRALSRQISPDAAFSNPRTPAQLQRVQMGQTIGLTLGALALGASRAGLMRITGEAEQQLGKEAGAEASSRQAFEEAAQKGDPEFSVMFGNVGLSYKDIPGVNAILYGIHLANKEIDADAGQNTLKTMGLAAAKFYGGAYKFATPFLGKTTLNGPLFQFLDGLMDNHTSEARLKATFNNMVVSASKMAIPVSSLLRDVKHAYETTPQESHQELLQAITRDIPGAAELTHSKPLLDGFGEPEQMQTIARVPGASRIASVERMPSSDLWAELRDKGLIVPRVGNTISFPKSATEYNPQFVKSREDRLNTAYSVFKSAYANSLTPDEWYEMQKAVGPQVKRVAESIINSNLPQASAQQYLTKTVRSIWTQSLKNYVATGQF